MNGRPLTDTQISQALRAHLPETASPGLRERVFDAAETTPQLRSFPLFLGALNDADPVGRRRSLLIAAALLLALALASAAAVGAWRLFQRDPMDELSLEAPADLPAFVLSTSERLPDLPPVAFMWHDSSAWPNGEQAQGRVYVDRSGTVRFDRFTSVEATEPSSSTILNADHRISGIAPVDSKAVWIDAGHEAIGDDPRVFLRGLFTVGGGKPPARCAIARDQGDVTDANVATGWRYVGVENVAGRPTHHVACVGDLSLDTEIWIDIETRLILRTREPLTDDAGHAVPGRFATTEVTEIAFGEQPAALFGPPDGLTRMSADAYGAYLCTHDPSDEERVGLPGLRESCSADATPEPTTAPEPSATPTALPSLGPPPSGPAGPLAWTEASLKEDWPAPIRAEPAGGAPVLPIRHRDLTPHAASDEAHTWESDQYRDPIRDTGSDAYPWADIRWVEYCREDGLDIGRFRDGPHAVDPRRLWLASGVVVDSDDDGVADWRYGHDNTPLDSTDSQPDRWWRTNLHTGRTDYAVGDHIALRDGGPGPVFWGGPGCDMSFGAETAGNHDVKPGLPERFYAWASVIENGRVVATDYAPDVGWLDRSPDAKTLPKPGGPYVLHDLRDPDRGPFPQVSMTIPDGWILHRWAELTRGKKTAVRFEVIDSPGNPCTDRIKPFRGHGFDDLVRYFKALPNIDISEMRYDTVDGYRAAYVEYRPKGLVECGPDPAGPIPLEDGYNETWILDVDGVPLAIAASYGSAPTESIRSEIRQIVDSIRIER